MNQTQTQEARLLRIVEGSKDGLWDWNLQTNEVFFNNQSYNLLDIPKGGESPTFDTILNRICPGDVVPTQLAMQNLLANGVTYQVEHHIKLADGSLRYCLCRGDVTERSPEGKPTVVSGTITDVTHLKHIEQSLQKAQARLDRVISGSKEGFWEWDVLQDTLYWSERHFELLGIPCPDAPLNYQFFEDLLADEDKARIKAAISRTVNEGVPFCEEFRMRHASGNYLYLYSRAQPYYNDMGELTCISGMIADVTRQKQQELLLKESEERFRTMAEASPVMIWMTDPQGTITYINKTYREFLGKPDTTEYDGLTCIHPDDLPRVQETLCAAVQHPAQGEIGFRLRRADGAYRWVYTIWAPRWRGGNKFMGLIGSTMDITQLKLTEQVLKDYAAKLEQSNQELDQFVLIASHDLQEPLRKIALFSGFLKAATQEQNLPDECNDYIDRMQQAVARMQNLINDLLVLSRITRKAQPPLPTDLGEVLQTVLVELDPKRRSVQGTITVGPTMTIDVDETQIYQVFYNLIDNALKFHRKDTPPVVQVDMSAINPGTCEITISDNGIGFDEKYLDRIFKIFERLHGRGEYEGSGVGLAIAQKIVERHKGTLTAHSQQGQGSTFTIQLPIHA